MPRVNPIAGAAATPAAQARLAEIKGAFGTAPAVSATVALNLSTNQVNVAFDVAVDFPRVRLTARAA